MKKKIIIIILILVAAITVSAFAFYKIINRKYELVLQSEDGKVSYDFGKISNVEIEQKQPTRYCCEITNVSLDSLLEDKFKDNIIYLDDNHKKTDKASNKCYICIENHYFYFEVYDTNKLMYRELFTEFFPQDSDGGYMFSPFYDKDALAWGEDNILTWRDTVGLTSFEDLVNFYKNIDSSLYEVDEENRTITLKLLLCTELSQDKATITVNDDNIVVRLIQNKEEN